MRLVDADALETVITQLNENGWEITRGEYKLIDNVLFEMPTIEPEIVRCKACRHRDPEDHKCDCGHDIIWQLPRDDKWYCADAERRTDGRSDK